MARLWMMQKAAKSLAGRNVSRLKQTHLTTIFVHSFFLFFRAYLFRHSTTSWSFFLYVLLSAPAIAIEFWLERIARPQYRLTDAYGGRELVRPGEDLDSTGVTEWCWDVVYWTWGVVGLVAAFGDWAWSLWGILPLYTIWTLYSTYRGARSGFSNLMGGAGAKGDDASGQATGLSKRQQKAERRGGQKTQFR